MAFRSFEKSEKVGFMVTYGEQVVERISNSGLPPDLIDFDCEGSAPAVEVVNPDSAAALKRIWIGLDSVGEALVAIDVAQVPESIEGYWWKTEVPNEDLVELAISWLEAFIYGHLVLITLRPRVGHLVFDVRDPAARSIARFRNHPTVNITRYPPIAGSGLG